MAPSSEIRVGQAACASSTTVGNPSSKVAKGQELRELVAYDTGAERPAFNDLKWFLELHLLKKPSINLGTAGMTITTLGGVAAYKTKLSTGEEMTVELEEAIYNPQSPVNLICSAMLQDEGIYWDQKRHNLYDEDTGQVVTELRRDGNLFVVTNAVPAAEAPAALAAAVTAPVAVSVPVGATASHVPAVRGMATEDGRGFCLALPADLAQMVLRGMLDLSGPSTSSCAPEDPL